MKVPDESDDWQEELSEDEDNSSSETSSSSLGASNGNWEGDCEGGEASNGYPGQGEHLPLIVHVNFCFYVYVIMTVH